MSKITDALPPAPVSPLPANNRVMHIGGVQYLVNARHGGFLASQNDFFIGNALIRYGEYGENELHLFQQLVAPEQVVVEVGANIGAFTVPLAKRVGVKGRIIAIEPQRIIHQYLCANIALNGLPNVETYHAGCAARNTTMFVPQVPYYSPSRGNFGGVALGTQLGAQGEGEPVGMRTVDDIVGERKVHMLRITVEGMEADVLRGAKRMLRKHRPLVHVENDRQDKSEALIKLLFQYGYRCFWHMTNLFNAMNFFEQKDNIYGNTPSLNLLCIPVESNMDMRHFQEVTDARSHPLRR